MRERARVVGAAIARQIARGQRRVVIVGAMVARVVESPPAGGDEWVRKCWGLRGLRAVRTKMVRAQRTHPGALPRPVRRSAGRRWCARNAHLGRFRGPYAGAPDEDGARATRTLGRFRCPYAGAPDENGARSGRARLSREGALPLPVRRASRPPTDPGSRFPPQPAGSAISPRRGSRGPSTRVTNTPWRSR